MPGTLAAKPGKAIKMYKKQKDTYIFEDEYRQSFFGISILLTMSEQANEQSSKKLVLPASKRRMNGQIQGGIRGTHNIVASGERMGGQRLNEKVSLRVCGR